MTSERIDRYVETLRRALKAHGVIDDRFVAEARAHLVDDVDARVARGVAPDEAAREAVERFGSPDAVADAWAATQHVVFGRIVGAVSLLTMVAALFLCASVLVVRPPHAEVWFPLAVNTFICVAQGLLTLCLIGVIGRASTSLLLRIVVTFTSLAMSIEAFRIAVAALHDAHFEGYAVVLAAMMFAQGLLTIIFVTLRIKQRSERYSTLG